MEKNFVARFERQVLFRIARFVAFSICLLLFIAMVGGAIYATTYGAEHSERPDAAGVAQSLKPIVDTPQVDPSAGAGTTGPSTLASDSVLQGVRIPPVMQELMVNPDNQRVFRNWLDELPDEEHQPFIDGLAKAVDEARRININDSDALNAYHERYKKYVEDKQIAELKSKEQRLLAAGFAATTLMLLALFSLVLVLLAIERNTRLQPAGATA